MDRTFALHRRPGRILRGFVMIAVALFVVVTGLGACARSAQDAVSTSTRSPPSAVPAVPAEVTTEVVRDCAPGGFRGVGGPLPGELAIDFTLKDVHGDEHHLLDLLAEKPVVLVFGSFT